MIARISCIAGLLLCALATVQAASFGSVAFFNDNYCGTPMTKQPSAAGGLPTDGTCTPLGYDSSSGNKLFHRLTCGSNGPQYDYFTISYYGTGTADPCSGSPAYSIKGTSSTTDTTCLTPSSSSTALFSVEIQCTEKIYQDRSSTTYYTYTNSTCDGARAFGPLYDAPLDTCQTSSYQEDEYMYLDGYVDSTSIHCSYDGAYTLSTEYADGKCEANSWMKMTATKTGQCKLTQTASFSGTGSYQYYYRKVSCPSNPPVTATRPIFPPDMTTSTDVALRYSCDYNNCTSCLPYIAYKLGQCQEQTDSFPPTADTLSSVKRACTQDGQSFGLSTYRDGQCQTPAAKVELNSNACTNKYYLVCPAVAKASAQVGPLPSVGRINFNRHNCSAPTADSPAAYSSASFQNVGCTVGSYASANATLIVTASYYGTGAAACNKTAMQYNYATYTPDVCVDGGYYSATSFLATSSYSTSPAFTIATGTATSDSVKPPLIGDSAFISLSTPTSLYNSSLWKNEYIRCASTFTSVRASRISISVMADTAGTGSIVTLTFTPGVVTGDTTPAIAVGLLLGKSGKLPSNYATGDQACDPVNGIYAYGGATAPTTYGTTAKFSMAFNIPFGSFSSTVKAQLIREVAAVANIDPSRITAPTLVSLTGSSQTTVYFEITPSTDGTVTTPNAALNLITAKVQSTDGMPGTYASQAVKQAPTVTADGTGGSSGAASALSVNFIMQLAMAAAAIVALMQ